MKQQALTNKELKCLLKAASPSLRALILTGCATGLRVSELLSMTHREIFSSFSARSPRIWLGPERLKGKKKGRAVWLDLASLRALKRIVRQQGADTRIWPFTRIHAARLLWKACDNAGIQRRGTHCFRKTFAARAYKALHEICLVAAVIGHESINTTLRYLAGCDTP